MHLFTLMDCNYVLKYRTAYILYADIERIVYAIFVCELICDPHI